MQIRIAQRIAYCEGRKVCTVYRQGKRWFICWHSRGDARERIANFDAAQQWVARLLHGKRVDWIRQIEEV